MTGSGFFIIRLLLIKLYSDIKVVNVKTLGGESVQHIIDRIDQATRLVAQRPELLKVVVPHNTDESDPETFGRIGRTYTVLTEEGRAFALLTHRGVSLADTNANGHTMWTQVTNERMEKVLGEVNSLLSPTLQRMIGVEDEPSFDDVHGDEDLE